MPSSHYSISAFSLAWDLEADAAFEAVCLPCPIRDTQRQPNAAQDLRPIVEIPPEPGANQKPEQGRDGVAPALLFRPHEVPEKRRRVHAHESDQRAEVQKQCSEIVADE